VIHGDRERPDEDLGPQLTELLNGERDRMRA
jgi:hypothetical protein